MTEEIEEGDHVTVALLGRGVHWIVDKIDSRIDPLGVRIISGMSNRARYETYSNLTLFRKGTPQ